ncbi:MAG: hypothetical protein RL403_1040, partial [Bacteroidota bacterium]
MQNGTLFKLITHGLEPKLGIERHGMNLGMEVSFFTF